MGQRSRKRRREGARPRVRGEERDALIRESLEPLEADERPRAVTIAAVVATLLGIGNLVMLAAGVEVRDEDAPVAGTIIFAAIMFVAAWGMWRAKYWAVLGFQALLAITLVIAGSSLLVASNVAAVALCLAILGLGGWLFWKLIRALARLQMPDRRSRPSDV
jgi:cation transport ATPase